MTHSKVSQALAKLCAHNIDTVEDVIRAFTHHVTDELRHGRSVRLQGLGVFSLKRLNVSNLTITSVTTGKTYRSSKPYSYYPHIQFSIGLKKIIKRNQS